MRVFMLKSVHFTAVQKAASRRAPGPCPGRRGQGFALNSGSRGAAPRPWRRLHESRGGQPLPPQLSLEAREARPRRLAPPRAHFITSQRGGS